MRRQIVHFWLLASVLPGLFVLILVATHRLVPLSHTSYLLITLYLTLHTIGTHYTYAQMPAGAWLEGVMHFGRNHYDRLVHFCFGFLLAYPVEELFRLATRVRGWLLYYLPVMTILGLSGLWEIIESWVARSVQPEAGMTYLGSQGDVWDARRIWRRRCMARCSVSLCCSCCARGADGHRPRSRAR